MVETVKKVTLSYESFKKDELLRVRLKVECKIPYVSSEWPSRIILWLSRRYHVVTSYFAISGDSSFILTAIIVSDEDSFRRCSRNLLLEYVGRIDK